MIEAILTLKVPKTCAVHILKDLPAEVRVLESKPYEDDGVRNLIEIKSKECLDDVISSIEGNPEVYKKDFFRMGSKLARGGIAVKKCSPARAIIESECFISSAQIKGDDLVWRLLCDQKSLKKLTDNLKARNFFYDIKKVGKIDEKELLTEKEDDIIRYAMERGYFETPKKIGVRELAKHYGLSISTISEILRRGQKKIIFSFFKEK